MEMLKYFKRHKNRQHTSSVDDETIDVDSSVKRHSLRSSSSFCDEVFLEELSLADEDALSLGAGVGINDDLFKYHSRLSMTLPSIVNDPNCLSYFVQYLDTKNALPLIKFYLDTENFKTAAIAQLEKDKKQKTVSTKETKTDQREYATAAATEAATAKIEKHLSDKKNEEDESSSVPELKTLCDISMRKSLTDDEKSQIYAQTNKQISECNSNHNNNKLKANSELSLCSEFSADVATEPEIVCDSVAKISSASVKDAIAIYQKYLIANAKQFVCLPLAILSQISLLLCKCNDDVAIQTQTLPISSNCFDEAQDYVLQQLERDYLNDFLQSIFYCKYCVDLIERAATMMTGKYEEQLNIYDILYSEVTLFFFMEFLEQQGERDCLDFWTAAINFRKSFANDAAASITTTTTSAKQSAEAQADAMIIYDKFFSLQSEHRLWMSDKLRSHVEQRICADDNAVAYCFDLALQVMAKYLERKYFADFLKSQLFENYLNELKTKIHEEHVIGTVACEMSTASGATVHHKLSFRRANTNNSNNKNAAHTRHRKTLSDCTNACTRNEQFKHISQQNTLLAMDTSHLKHALHGATGTNMNIDARQLTNPNLLWQRAHSLNDGGTSNTANSGGLKFGRINALGRYERDFEAIDAVCNNTNKHSWSLAKGGNKIKNAMRKLVNMPEDKLQEEIAWQVAEMIVKDVTSVTLKNQQL